MCYASREVNDREIKMRMFVIASCFILLPNLAFAGGITVYMDAWEHIPQVQLSQGHAIDCSMNTIIYSGPMDRPYERMVEGTGPNGDDLCWRRTADPLDPNSGLQKIWTRCADLVDLRCEIN
jgi:hypothetical protein